MKDGVELYPGATSYREDYASAIGIRSAPIARTGTHYRYLTLF